jgi:serine/threonine-protein kinase
LREAETVARIDHPNVVDITDVGIEGDVPYLVMEFLEGEDLSRLLERSGALAVDVTVDTVLPVISGLAAVHRLGIVHRDLKPENVLLARTAQGDLVPKLIDFGVSKDLGASGRAGGVPAHTVTGTPHYMSPEQARGAASMDARTDQYALGVLLYQCLTGIRPFDSESLLELIHLIDVGEFRPLRAHAPNVPAELEHIVHRAMARHARDRFASTEELGRALLPFASPRTRMTHEREFEGDGSRQASALSTFDREMGARLAAETLPAEAFSAAQPQRLASGVRSRPSGEMEASPDKRFPRWAVAVLALLALAGAAWFALAPRPPAATPAPAVMAPPAPAAAAKSVAPAEPDLKALEPVVPTRVDTLPAPVPAPAHKASRRKRSAPASAPAQPQPAAKPSLDIQLSR